MSDLWDGWSPGMARGYVAHRISAPFEIDGRLDKPPWRDIAWTEDFIDIEGGAKPPPRFRTRAKMCWDDHCLYIAAEMQEPHVWATLTVRDSVIFHDNDFEVFIDPDGDHCDYYELEINALNTVWDLRLPRPYRDGGTAINEWDIAGLRTAVHVDGTLNDPSDIDRGWSVEIAIPWTAMAEYSTAPAPPRDGDQWRINFSRVQWQNRIAPHPSDTQSACYQKLLDTREDNWVWSPQGVIDMHRPERWGYVQFTTSPTGTRVAFQPDPLAPAKWYLQRLHEAQRAHHQRTGIWAGNISGLEIPQSPPDSHASINPDGEAYQATLRMPGTVLMKDSTGALRIPSSARR